MYDSIFTKENVTLVTLSEIPTDTVFRAELFNTIGNSGVSVDMICRPTDYRKRTRLDFTVDDKDLHEIMCIVAGFGIKSSAFSAGCCKVCVKDQRLAESCGESGKIFSALASHGVDILLVTTDYDEISVLVRSCDFEKAGCAVS